MSDPNIPLLEKVIPVGEFLLGPADVRVVEFVLGFVLYLGRNEILVVDKNDGYALLRHSTDSTNYSTRFSVIQVPDESPQEQQTCHHRDREQCQ